MIDISIETHKDLYLDYKKALLYLKGINYLNFDYPNENTFFHLYSELNTEKELLSLKSYLATQNLEKTSLIVWSDYDISTRKDLDRYKGLVDFRIYDAKELATGSPIEDSEIHLNLKNNANHWMSSGIMRFLALFQFGGIYLDMDMVLLRDFKPILNQDFAYQWGASIDFSKKNIKDGDCHGPCAAMLGAVKGGNYIKKCLDRLSKTPPSGGTCYDEDMLAYVYRDTKFTVFPSAFFNTEWQMNTSYKDGKRYYNAQGEGTLTESGWFKRNEYSDRLFLEAFSWHWHNSSYRDKKIENGSKFNLLQDKISELLKNKGII